MNVHEVAAGVWVAYRPAARPARPPAQDVVQAARRPRARAREFLAGRALLRDLLRATGAAGADLPVVAGENGKPRLAGAPSVGITISHDGGHVAAAVAVDREVGVDLQMPPRHVSAAMIRRCAPRDAHALMALPPAALGWEFAWIWTAQEACVKADGSGVGGRPWTVDVPLGTASGGWRGTSWRCLRLQAPYPISCAWRMT